MAKNAAIVVAVAFPVLVFALIAAVAVKPACGCMPPTSTPTVIPTSTATATPTATVTATPGPNIGRRSAAGLIRGLRGPVDPQTLPSRAVIRWTAERGPVDIDAIDSRHGARSAVIWDVMWPSDGKPFEVAFVLLPSEQDAAAAFEEWVQASDAAPATVEGRTAACTAAAGASRAMTCGTLDGDIVIFARSLFGPERTQLQQLAGSAVRHLAVVQQDG